MTEKPGATRIVLFDDQPLYVKFLARDLTQAGFDVVGEASTPAELQQVVRSTDFDIALMDVLVGDHNELTGLAIGLWLRQHLPKVGVLMFTSYNSPFPAFHLIKAGPSSVGIGYLLKTRVHHNREIFAALADLKRGHNVLDSGIRNELVSLESGTHPGNRLDDVDLEVLRLLVEGRTNQQIAADLHFSRKTIETKITAIFRKLGLSKDDAQGLSEDDTQERPNPRVKAVMAWVDSLAKFRDAKAVTPIDWPDPQLL